MPSLEHAHERGRAQGPAGRSPFSGGGRLVLTTALLLVGVSSAGRGTPAPLSVEPERAHPPGAVAHAPAASPEPALHLEKQDTPLVYFTYGDRPLLSFGGLSDFIFYGGRDAYDYRLWADWGSPFSGAA